MNKLKKVILVILLLISNFYYSAFANEEDYKITNNIQAVETTPHNKYSDYAKMYSGEDKFEKFNRKMFNLNTKLNKYGARPIHILWSSIMPKYGIERIRDAYNNIEYPKRLVSSIIQCDGQAIKNETIRFITNTTLGLGGLFDPADKLLKIKPTNENMEQALGKCKMKSGSYLVMPVLHSCTPRSLCGRALEAVLDPVIYTATPITSIIKFGLMLNRTSYIQPIAQMLESTYADPYDIQKKLFGLENYIKGENLDRADLISAYKEKNNDGNVIEKTPNIEELIKPDLILKDYKIQTPVVDSMKTALFENKEINKSMWNELSVWNRSFAKRIKTDTVEITSNRDKYKFNYILQKDKNAPLVVIYPSIGEGAGAHHSIVFAKLFYDKGFSIVMQGSHFHWEFVNSMPDGYAPGNPLNDSDNTRLITKKILDLLCQKYNCNFEKKYIVGTSFGAYMSLFTAYKESVDNTLGITKFIAISPPIELVYALEQLDNNSSLLNDETPYIKEKTAVTASKIMQISKIKNENKGLQDETLPFSEDEGKMITAFILRQKLSDLIHSIEHPNKSDKSEFYNMINNMSYRDYVEKYLTNGSDIGSLRYDTSLFSIANYLKNNTNYKIYHSLDDYFVNKKLLYKLKELAGENMTCINCGSHLGFLHRKEFSDSLLNDILGM